MPRERNPLYQKGERNAICPKYSDCLDEAVNKSWKYWDCCECDFKSESELWKEITFISNDPRESYSIVNDAYSKAF